jgi:hypothetical protein
MNARRAYISGIEVSHTYYFTRIRKLDTYFYIILYFTDVPHIVASEKLTYTVFLDYLSVDYHFRRNFAEFNNDSSMHINVSFNVLRI